VQGEPLRVDPVSLLGNRYALMEDLLDALEPGSRERVLGVFDLAGLEEYRVASGGPAADELVVRLARVLVKALGLSATCYRIRQDELCALVDVPVGVARPMLDSVVVALRDEGASSQVAASCGVAALPGEAEDPIEALIIADQELSLTRRARERRRSRR